MTNTDEDFEVFRGDLIDYLADRLELPPDDVLKRLGTWLVGVPDPDELGKSTSP